MSNIFKQKFTEEKCQSEKHILWPVFSRLENEEKTEYCYLQCFKCGTKLETVYFNDSDSANDYINQMNEKYRESVSNFLNSNENLGQMNKEELYKKYVG